MTENATWNGKPPEKAWRDGWHWLSHGGHLSPAFWSAKDGEWSQGGLFCGGSGKPEFLTADHFEGGVQYVAPCEMPDLGPVSLRR